MTKQSWSVLLLGLIVGLLAAQLLGSALAQQREEPWSGQRWEYRVFRMSTEDYEDKRDYQQILAKHGGDGNKADPAFQEHVLNYLGGEGWELITSERRYANQLHYYLKRPLR